MLQTNDETIVSAWVGGRSLRSGARTWTIDGRLPAEHGWFTFTVGANRRASVKGPTDAPFGALRHVVKGYLVGDRLVPDGVRCDPDPAKIIHYAETVHLIEPGLDRFARVSAGRTHEDGPLVYEGQDMPLGPEADVINALLDDKPSVGDILGVPPALDAAFRMERWQRVEAEARRRELERLRREEEERLALEARRRELAERIGTGAGRREMAQVDFPEAAKAALAVGGAVYLDSRRGARRDEMVIKFRYMQRRFECTCDSKTLRIIDSGICLTDHNSGERGDDRFTLESLPAVIKEAHDGAKLVVFRHVD